MKLSIQDRARLQRIIEGHYTLKVEPKTPIVWSVPRSKAEVCLDEIERFLSDIGLGGGTSGDCCECHITLVTCDFCNEQERILQQETTSEPTKFSIEDYEKMVKHTPYNHLLTDFEPTAQSLVDQQMADVERAAIAEFKAKNPNKPYSCGWHTDKNDPYLMKFTVVELPLMNESEVQNG
jgi:hypothetical protein